MRLARLRERSCMRHDSNTGSLGAKRACARFKNGSPVFRSHVHSSCVLRPLSGTRSLILNVSTCKVVCRRHNDPTNGPPAIQILLDYHESSRSIQWCIFLGVSSWKHLTCPTSRQSSDRPIGDPGMVHPRLDTKKCAIYQTSVNRFDQAPLSMLVQLCHMHSRSIGIDLFLSSSQISLVLG